MKISSERFDFVHKLLSEVIYQENKHHCMHYMEWEVRTDLCYNDHINCWWIDALCSCNSIQASFFFIRTLFQIWGKVATLISSKFIWLISDYLRLMHDCLIKKGYQPMLLLCKIPFYMLMINVFMNPSSIIKKPKTSTSRTH